MTPTNFTLVNAGETLQAFRKATGISLETLARRLGWSQERLLELESDISSVNLVELDAINKALKKKPNTLLMTCLRVRYPSLAVVKHKQPSI